MFNPVNIICFILLSLSMQIYMDIFFEKRHWHLILVNPVIACMTYIILIIFPNVNPWGNIAIVIIFFSIYGMFIYQGRRDKIFFHIVLWKLMRCLCEYIVLFILSLSYAQEVIFKKDITILQERYLIVCWFFLPYASAGLFLIKKAME